MGTSDRDLAWFLERSPEVQDVDPQSFRPGDWSRLSVEASAARATGTARAMKSQGSLRLHGTGVQAHAAPLSHVGFIAAAWQKAVSAVGAALEDHRSLRGALPAHIAQRTMLVLNAAPAPGSIVLHVEPQSAPMDEVEPNGNIPIQEARPLADRASEELIDVLLQASSVELAMTDGFADALRALGPRVGSTLTGLAQAIHRSGITVDASWTEPGAAAVKASVTPTAAKWIRDFVAGRGLDAEEQTLMVILRTVSDRERWLVELEGGETERMSAAELPPEEIARWRVGESVRLRARTAFREQPDGTVHRSHTILGLSPADDNLSP